MSFGILEVRELPLTDYNWRQKENVGTGLILGLLKGEFKLIHMCYQIAKKSHE